MTESVKNIEIVFGFRMTKQKGLMLVLKIPSSLLLGRFALAPMSEIDLLKTLFAEPEEAAQRTKL